MGYTGLTVSYKHEPVLQQKKQLSLNRLRDVYNSLKPNKKTTVSILLYLQFARQRVFPKKKQISFN